jgi:hypothetical protein
LLARPNPQHQKYVWCAILSVLSIRREKQTPKNQFNHYHSPHFQILRIMKKLVQVSIIAFLFLTCAQTAYSQSKVCCACNGRGQWFYNAFYPGTTVPYIQTVYCSLCGGHGKGDCDFKKDNSGTTPDPHPSKVYFDYLLKLVNCHCGARIPSPDEFWSTRPDLKQPKKPWE